MNSVKILSMSSTISCVEFMLEYWVTPMLIMNKLPQNVHELSNHNEKNILAYSGINVCEGLTIYDGRNNMENKFVILYTLQDVWSLPHGYQ